MNLFAVLVMVALLGLQSGCSDNPVKEKDPIACDHVDAEGLVVEFGGNELASQWQGAVQGMLSLTVGTPLTVTVTFLDADSARVVFSDDCPDHSLRWVIGDTTVLRVQMVTGQRMQALLTGLKAGATTLRFRVWHGEHSDFTSLEIPVVVSDSASSPAYFVDGCAVMHNSSMLLSYNYDRGTGAGQSYGALIVRTGEDLTGLAIDMLDTLADTNGIRFPVALSAQDSLAVTVADNSVAMITAPAAGSSQIVLHGLKAGTTTFSVRLFHAGASQYVTGGMRVIVADSFSSSGASFSITQGGVWRVICRAGSLITVDSLCANRTPTGLLGASAGELTDLFSFKKLDSCTRSDYASSQRYLVFDIADPGIARIVRHPIHWGEHYVFHVEGLAPGNTSVTCYLVRSSDQAVEYVAPPIPIQITG